MPVRFKDVDIRHKAGHDESEQRASASDKPELGPLALGQFRDCLPDDDILEMPGLLVIGEGRFTGEHFVEEKFVRLGRVLVDLEFLHAGFLLGLRQEFLQQSGDGAFLAGIDLPKRRDDQTLVCAVVHRIRSCVGQSVSIGDGANYANSIVDDASVNVE
jgi:hypothetical protein